MEQAVTEEPLPPVSAPRARPPGRALLVIVILSIAAGAFRELRIEVGDLLIPLHVFPLTLGLVFLLGPRFGKLPPAFRVSSITFLALFSVTCLLDWESIPDLMKVATAFFGLFFAATAVGDVRGFKLCALVFAIAILVMNIKGFLGGFVAYVGYKPLSGISNKNAYSLYSLPAMLLSAFTVLHFKPSRTAIAIHAANVVSSAFILLSGANRSGWLGVVAIAAMLAAQSRRIGAFIGVCVLGVASLGAIEFLGTTETFEHRLEQTREGNSGDDLRQSLFVTSMEIAIDYPVLGASPVGLCKELAKRLDFSEEAIDPHNLPGYVAGGAGFPALIAFCVMLFSLMRRPRGLAGSESQRALDLLRMSVVLFIFRSMFSAEIITTPAFLIAMGMALGLLQSTVSVGVSKPNLSGYQPTGLARGQFASESS